MCDGDEREWNPYKSDGYNRCPSLPPFDRFREVCDNVDNMKAKSHYLGMLLEKEEGE